MNEEKRERQFQRIAYYEGLLQKAEAILSSENPSGMNTADLRDCLRELEAYYVSADWKQDFSDEEAGLLPAALQRGVLSEDGIYNILEEGREWMDQTTPIRMVLFDLDGTLLPMDQEEFVQGYFGLLAKKCAPHGYEPQKLVESIWAGTAAMVKNNGSRSNYEAFWEKMAELYGESVRKDIPLFDDFYANEFQQAKAFCGFHPKAAETVKLCKQLGFRVALATNPLFPSVATESRIRWAGLEPSDFELFTTYENSGTCKPNPAYYREVLDKLGLAPADCLMVGNDVGEDMIAETLGMRVFLLTDCLIHKDGGSLDRYPHGGFPELMRFLREQAGQ